MDVREVGRRPGKEIDGLLSGRVIVVGDDADLAAVVLRLLRRELLGSVEVGFAPGEPTAATRLWGLPKSAEPQARAAMTGSVRHKPLARDDAGGVLLADGRLSPLDGPVYVDEHRVLGGPAHELRVAARRDQGPGRDDHHPPAAAAAARPAAGDHTRPGRADRHHADNRRPRRRPASAAHDPLDLVSAHRAAADRGSTMTRPASA